MGTDFSHGVVTESQKADLPAIVGAAGYPTGPKQGMISVARIYCGEDIGPLCNFDVWASAPAVWRDVTFSLRGRTQDGWAELDVATLPDAQHRITSAAGDTGLLFEWRGDPCDEFVVYAFNTAVDHSGVANMASFCGRGWGGQSGREVYMPYAPNRRERHSVTTTVNATPTVALTAPLSGRALYVSAFEVTHNNAAAQICELSSQLGTAPAVLLRRWIVPTSGIIQSLPKPLRLPPGAQLTVTGTAAATVIFDISGFED